MKPKNRFDSRALKNGFLILCLLLAGCESAETETEHHSHSHNHTLPDDIEQARMILFSHWIAIKQLPQPEDEEFTTLLRQIPLVAIQNDLPQSEWDEINLQNKQITQRYLDQQLTLEDLQAFSDFLLTMHRKAVALDPSTTNKAHSVTDQQEDSNDA